MFFPLAIVIVVATTGAFLLPRKFESSTTILAQRDEILNPIVNYNMAVSLVSEDRLKTFNEIVFSKASIETLIDSLNLGGDKLSAEGLEDLTKRIKKNIETDRPGTATFKISYTDSDPFRAQRGALLLAHHFIAEILKAENQRNELAVQFFEKKLDEFRFKFEAQQKEIVDLLRSRVQEMPIENQTLFSNVDGFDKEITGLDHKVKDLERGLVLLRGFSGSLESDTDKQMLYELDGMDLPHIAELHPLVMKFEELAPRYTSRYPEMRKLTTQITDILTSIRSGLEEEINRQEKSRSEIGRRRSQSVDNLKQTTAAQQVDKDKQANFDILRNLYDEMQVKLEQARTTRDLGRTGRDQFTLLDPPIVPIEAAKPNRSLIIGGGIGFGLILGIFSAALSELLDPTIRTLRDIGVYKKRVIAYIPETTGEPIS